jgi:hypothetical protein
VPKIGNGNGNAEKTKDQLYLNVPKSESQCILFFNQVINK